MSRIFLLGAALCAVCLHSGSAADVNVRDFGAVGDGVAMDTRALQQAIDACPSGGAVSIPPGVYLSGALWLKSDMTLKVERGAVLQGSASADDYPVWTWWFEGRRPEPCYASLLNVPVAGVSNLVIRGEGIIDGNGEKLIIAEEQIGKKGKRGRILGVSNSRNVRLEGVTFRQSASWCLHFIYCEDVIISNVTVRTREDEKGREYRGIHNGDGIDIDSSRRVLIENCRICSQDDCIAIKSGRNDFGRKTARPTEDVCIRNCFFDGGFGVTVGSEMSGDVRRINVRDCVYSNSFSVAGIKSLRGRGGVVEDVCFENIRFVNRSLKVKDTRWYRGGIYLDMQYSVVTPRNGEWRPPDEGTPRFRRITFRNIDAETVVSSAIYAAGLPESCIEDLVFDRVRAKGRWGMLGANLKGVTMSDCEIEMEEGDRFRLENVTGLSLTKERTSVSPAVPCCVERLEDVWSPRIVATPPASAVRDMCVTSSGQIRHYGFRDDGRTNRFVYIASDDNGMSWRTVMADPSDVGAMVRSPWSGEWIYFSGRDPVMLVRSKTGPGDTSATRAPMPWKNLELRQLTPLKSRKRWLAAFSDVTCENGECYHAVTAYSDDDGHSWVRTNLRPVANVARMSAGDKRPHWFNDGCEPTFVELKDGSILLCVRTSGPHAAFYRSTDGGETWGEGRPNGAFWQSNTMPYLFRMKDGRILFFWNNTASLPTGLLSEYPELSYGERIGRWESAFTNRDALHAAISDDEGKTWRGFREVALNEIRNSPDFRELGNGPFDEHDKSIHQTQAVELPGGKVLLAYGQNRAARRMLVFDPDWLKESTRTEDFRHGLNNLSTHLYVKSCTGSWRGWAGHCAWNRISGSLLVRDPHMDCLMPGEEPSNRDVLQLCRICDERLVSDRQGVVWNYPASPFGCLELECRIVGSGFRLTLSDHWMNPSDETGPGLCPFSEHIDDAILRVPGWHRVKVDWSGSKVRVSVDGRELLMRDGVCIPRFGFSYVHLQTLAEDSDAKGTYFRRFCFSGKAAR